MKKSTHSASSVSQRVRRSVLKGWISFWSSRWPLFLSIAWICGLVLRVIYTEDMEYKEDEEYNFIQSQKIGTTDPWPWFGIPSGVYLVNPGMSIWVFAGLAKLFHAHTPLELAHAVQIFALLGMTLVIPFAQRFVEPESRKYWNWALALSLVNPFLMLYQRKLWPEPFLPFFTMLTLMGWWRRSSTLGAILWGMVGAWLGQIHMSGFFFSGALFLWTFLFGKHVTVPSSKANLAKMAKTPRLGAKANSKVNSKSKKKNLSAPIKWKAWFFGSVLGSLPLIPWFIYVIQHPLSQSMTQGWKEIIQFKYWTFWLTNPLGLHLGNPLGLLRGPSQWDQISDFVRYPLIEGQATYINGLAHLGAAVVAIWILIRGVRSFYKRWQNQKRLSPLVIGTESNTAFVQNSILIGCGLLLTLTGVMIRRYYMAVTYPLEFIFLARMAGPDTKTGQRLLGALWLCELIISANFVGYIHVNQGSVWGDYGKAYHLVATPEGSSKN